jgi:hypothetical protein
MRDFQRVGNCSGLTISDNSVVQYTHSQKSQSGAYGKFSQNRSIWLTGGDPEKPRGLIGLLQYFRAFDN